MEAAPSVIHYMKSLQVIELLLISSGIEPSRILLTENQICI